MQVQQDMYGTYPELSAHKHYVEAASRQLAPQYGAAGWSPEFRDAIAERVAPLVPGLYQKIQQQRAMRVGAQQAVPQPMPQPLPQQQVPQALPPGVQPVGIAGAAYGQPPAPQAQQPMLVRDATGNLVSVASPAQTYLGGAQARPGGSPVDAELADIWQTLGYT